MSAPEARRPGPSETLLALGGRSVRVRFVHQARARRYILRIKPDGLACVTVPRQGSLAEAVAFVQRHAAWIRDQLLRQASLPVEDRRWRAGGWILFRGAPVELRASPDGRTVLFADQMLQFAAPAEDFRPAVEARLRELALRELPTRTQALAGSLGLTIGRVSIRNQRSRWGSCSARGTICLNWRLVQMPDWVRDYVIAHELMHRREMNHSARFWGWVREVCPRYRDAIRWIKQHAPRLGRTDPAPPLSSGSPSGEGIA